MLRFLRYRGRHSLYFPRDWKLPQLNPIMSRSHSESGKRTTRLTEPLWIFELRQRLFSFAGRHRCGRRAESWQGQASSFGGNKLLPDSWNRGPDGNRTCSYCGSIHAEDLMAICRMTLVDDRYGVEGTTKSYKAYIRQPGVRNAGEGAIKFYMAHAPEKWTAADAELFSRAMRVTHERAEKKWANNSKPAA